jgi:hypothetical protein
VVRTQGYNSSPLVGFLLMLFNVRLGRWLGNPKRRDWLRDAPRLSIMPALKELAGATTDDGLWIDLSDSGSFENLGNTSCGHGPARLVGKGQRIEGGNVGLREEWMWMARRSRTGHTRLFASRRLDASGRSRAAR